MAYREKTFNADTLTDLLNTYLSHKNLEREKYYQAELKRKTTYKAFGDELLTIGPSGDIQGVAMTKTSSSKNKLDTLYNIEDGSPMTIKNIKGQPHFYDKASNSMKILPDSLLSQYSVDKPTKDTKPKHAFDTWYNKDSGKSTMIRTQDGKAYRADRDNLIEIPPSEFGNYTKDRPHKTPASKDPVIETWFNKKTREGVNIKNVEGTYYKSDGGSWVELGPKEIHKYVKTRPLDKTEFSDHKKEVISMAKAMKKELHKIKQTKGANLYGGTLETWVEDKHGTALGYYNMILDNTDKWIKENPGRLPVADIYKTKNANPGSFWK